MSHSGCYAADDDGDDDDGDDGGGYGYGYGGGDGDFFNPCDSCSATIEVIEPACYVSSDIPSGCPCLNAANAWVECSYQYIIDMYCDPDGLYASYFPSDDGFTCDVSGMCDSKLLTASTSGATRTATGMLVLAATTFALI